MSLIDELMDWVHNRRDNYLDLDFVVSDLKDIRLTERERIEGAAFDRGSQAAQAAQDDGDRSRSGKYPV